MGNPLRGEASFVAGDDEKTLVFDVNVFCTLEADIGMGLTQIIEQVQGSPSFTLLRSIFCSGLQTRHPGTTIADTGTIMSDAGLEVITDALKRALQAAMPAKEGAPNPP